ncbi:3'-5' exonuclease-like [Lycium barbarum]|uniref:3'-5' exonuclease-like n=1 Tax=Lycium barbarum TaxID=112863 RepID=UPI00293F3201|nr:3'-5' exonuclease-like [Lycium barbarum]
MAEISRTQTQTLFCTVPFYEDQIKVTVTKTASIVDQWIGQTIHIHRKRLHKLLIGLDIEWLAARTNHDNQNPVALLQLCVGRRCLLFQLLHADYIPNSLYAFLGNPNFTYVGVGVHGDVLKLFNDYRLVVANPVDLNRLAVVVREVEEYGRIGLKRMGFEVLGKVMEKRFSVTMSQWDAEDLVYEQVEYACIDAFVSFEIGMNLFSEMLNTVEY